MLLVVSADDNLFKQTGCQELDLSKLDDVDLEPCSRSEVTSSINVLPDLIQPRTASRRSSEAYLVKHVGL